MNALGKKKSDYLDTRRGGVKRMLQSDWISQSQHFLKLKQVLQM